MDIIHAVSRDCNETEKIQQTVNFAGRVRLVLADRGVTGFKGSGGEYFSRCQKLSPLPETNPHWKATTSSWDRPLKEIINDLICFFYLMAYQPLWVI